VVSDDDDDDDDRWRRSEWWGVDDGNDVCTRFHGGASALRVSFLNKFYFLNKF
jgi:hypothetical protein